MRFAASLFVVTFFTQDRVQVDPERESYDFGKFGWITDPEGNRIELWQSAASSRE